MKARREKKPVVFHQVLIIIFGSMLLGGDDERPLTERVLDAVDDPDRAARAIALAEQFDHRGDERVASFVNWRPGFFELLASYDSTRVELDEKLRELMRELQRAETQLVDARFELRELLTEQEWNAIFD